MNESNGLAPQLEAVRAARERLARDLDVFNVEMRSEMGHTMEKTVWKLAGTGAAVVAGIAVRNVLMSAWRAVMKNEPPANPADPATAWGEALAWAAATGLAVGVARMIASRGAAAGWQKATGTLPPGLQDVS
jgi:cyanate permease